MIPNIVKGSDMKGLMRYLVHTGASSRDIERGRNAHTDPHVISGDSHLSAWYGVETLNKTQAEEIANYLDRPRKSFGTETMTGTYVQDPQTGERIAAGQKSVDVWHCSLSLPPGEVLSAEKWDSVANEFMDRMGFTDAEGKSPVRWVAIHHGTSKGGNDHIHIAASTVREDGTRWGGHYRDFPRSQQVCRDLERKHGLIQVGGAAAGTATRGPRPVESRKARDQGAQLTDREQLAHRLRAAAVGSASEAEWIRRVRADGVVLKPRFAAGTTDVVAGYRAALRPESRAARLDFYGGGQIARDLSLPRLRENWAEPSVEASGAAAAEWQAAFRGQRPAGTEGRETRRLARNAPDVAAHNLQAFTDRLARTPIGDRRAWADAARDTSGALSALARLDPANADELRQAAAVIARTAQEQRAGGQLSQRVKASPNGTALILLAAARDDGGKAATAVFMTSLLKAAVAIRDYHRELGDARHAEAVHVQVVTRLRELQPAAGPTERTQREPWRPPPKDRTRAPQTRPGSPLPNVVQPRDQIGTRTGREESRDVER